MRRLICLLAATAASIVPFSGHTAPPTVNGRPIYVFMDGNRWCGVSELATFKRRAGQANANQQDIDQGTFWLAGDRVATVEEYRTTVDLEWSTLIKYQVDPDGRVISAEASFHSDDAGEQKATFAVSGGRYRLIKGLREVSTFKFRRASNLSSFPFVGLARDFAASGAREKCK
jgi:hypothetical protein